MKAFVLLLLVWGAHAAETLLMHAPLIPAPAVLDRIPVKATYSTCNEQVLRSAQTTFNKMLGISSESDWTNAYDLVDAIRSVLVKGVDEGVLKVCAARSKFFMLLGATYDDCLSRFYFMRHGFTREMATAYVQVFKELEFMCNGGLLQSLRQWDCIQATQVKYNQKIENCRLTFANETALNPDQFCSKSETFMICIRAPFHAECGDDAGWYECESLRVSIEIDNYCPHLSCSYSLFPEQSSNAAVNPMLTRAQLFKSPNPYFMRKELQDLYASMGAKAIERAKRKKREALANPQQ